MVNFICDGCASGFAGRRPSLFGCVRGPLLRALMTRTEDLDLDRSPECWKNTLPGAFISEKRSNIKTLY